VSAATRARLARILEDDAPDLAEANLLVAAEGSRGLDMASCLAHVEGLADAARQAGVAATLRDRGFRGASDDYDDPRNSFLNEVLERRRGLPIALATLTLAVARRVGAPMAGIGMPGHFLVADLAGGEPVFLDPFDRWRRLSRDDCARIARAASGVRLRPEHLDPVTPRAIVARTLLNLRGSYLRRRRLADALWTVELGLIVSPGDPELAREAVTLLAGVGRYAEAEAIASARLAAHPADTALAVRLAAVRDLMRRMN
jgi:regulator of sirC expression with transglutaminase-like and TPR domain